MPHPTLTSNRHAARLLARIRRRFDAVTVPLDLGPFQLAFTRVADPDRVLDQVAEQADRRERQTGRRQDEDQLHLPYWAELWDSAWALALSLVRHPPSREQPVLDLGCGMGLAGVTAAALGARVVLADLEPPALLFARLNSLPWAARANTRRLDWRCDRLGTRFDLILGADILYERQQWEHLEPFWREHLTAGGMVLLGEPGRQTGDAFLQWVVTRGWRLAVDEQPVPTRQKPIRIIRLSRPASRRRNRSARREAREAAAA